MDMQTKGGDYIFSFVEFRQISELDRSHPIIAAQFPSINFSLVQSCPDIEDDFPVLAYLATQSGNIASYLMFIPDQLYYKSNTYRLAWAGSLFTSPDYRSKGLATVLIHNITAILHARGIAWAGVFSTEIALRIYRKLGFVVPGYARRYLALKSARPFLMAHWPKIPVETFAKHVSDPILKSFYQYTVMKRRYRTTNVKCIAASMLDLRIQKELFPKYINHTRFHFRNDFEKVRWKVDRISLREGNECELYILFDTISSKPLGYFVTRLRHQSAPLASRYKNFWLMTLMDYGTINDQLYGQILHESMSLFLKSRAEIFEIISNSKEVAKVARSFGLVAVGKGMSFKFSLPAHWRITEEYAELDSWPLTHFCGDGFTL
ncbi:MAG TPA: GNAT family N-acetyltransferase [Syntrophobacteraceae bacterium]|nr:GNAT family N-acetyltransferase [Syntrophobacteraceae bacterium]